MPILPLWVYALIGAALMAVGAGGGYAWEHNARVAEVAKLNQASAEYRDRMVAATGKTKDAVLAAIDAWNEQLGKVTHESAEQTRVARADADAARAERNRLSGDLAAYIAAARRRAANPAAAAGSPPTSDPLDLLAELFGRANQRAEGVSDYADAARIAGSTCERAYDAIRAGQQALIQAIPQTPPQSPAETLP